MPTSPRAVMRIIEGITAMCLGSAENLIWVDQTDAAAFSDGEHLYLPRPLGFHDQEYGLLLALALREVARIWHSKPEPFQELDPGVLTYSMLVEEVRLKMYLARTFLGAPAIFASAAATVCQQLGSVSEDPAAAERAKLLFVWVAGHAAVLEAPVLGEALARLETVARIHVGDERIEQAIRLTQGAGQAESTEFAIALGARLWTLLHPQQPAPEASDASTPGGNDDGDPAAQARDANGGSGAQPPQIGQHCAAAAPGALDEAAHDEAAGEAGSAEPGQGTAASQPSGGPDQARGSQPLFDPLSDRLAMLKGHPHAVSYAGLAAALRERGARQRSGEPPVSEAGQAMLAAMLNEPDADRGLLAMTAGFAIQDGPGQEGLTSQLGAGGGSPQRPDEAGRLLLETIPARLVTVLLRELQDVRRRPFQHSVTGPRLAAAKLWRLSRLGDTRLFRKRTPATGIDAAVSLLLDRSASMQRNGFEQAVAVTQAFMLALQRIDGVKTSLDVFPGTDAPIEQIVGFGQNQSRGRERLREIEPQGGTPTGSAIARRLRQLLDVAAQTKLMVVITDGQPDREEVDLLAAVLEQAGTFQVQVVGVGIGVDVRHRFPASISVRAVSELPDALAVLFKEALLRS